MNLEPGKLAMYIPTGTNALHNFLPDVTSLAEMKRALLLGFLRQITFANVLPITRNPRRDTQQFQCRGADLGCPGFE